MADPEPVSFGVFYLFAANFTDFALSYTGVFSDGFRRGVYDAYRAYGRCRACSGRPAPS